MDRMVSLDKKLVIGAATGYIYNQIAPFVNTLRATGYSGDICFIIYRNDKTLIKQLKKEGIKYLPISDLNSGSLGKLFKLRFNPRIQFVFKHLISIAKFIFGNNDDKAIILIGKISSYNLSIACSRYYYYYKYIRKHNYDKILVADTKDVLFQKNPFEHLGNGIHFALESKEVRIKDQPGNNKWVKKLFSAAEYEELKDQYISCSGTTIGNKGEMLQYFKLMISILSNKSHEIAGRYGYDQGAHNYIVWHRLIPNIHLVNNLDGFILTMVTTDQTLFSVNEKGDLINGDGSTIAIIHQYNWFPDLKFRVRGK